MRDPVYRFRGHQKPTAASRTPLIPATNAAPEAEVDDTVATMRLYDPVDDWGEFWGVSANEFAAALDTIPETVNELRLHINSPGGVIHDGIAILSQLNRWSASTAERRVVAVVDGIAASIASVIAVGVSELVMNPDSMLMIHDGSGVAFGTAADMHAAADSLDLMSNTIAGVYARKAGGTTEEWRDVMTARGIYGQWYSAQEALDAGLADRVVDEPTRDESDDQATARAATHRAALSAVTTEAQATPATPVEVPAPEARQPAAAASDHRADADRHRRNNQLRLTA